MEALFMKSGFQLSRIVDAFTSFIWTDRYCGYGDFELRLPMTDSALTSINVDDFVGIKESDHYMIVEKIVIESDTQVYATISGRSLESLLDRRIVWNDMILTGNLQDAVLRLMNNNVISPAIENRKMPDVSFVKSVDPEVTNLTINLDVEAGDNLYDVILSICELEHLGFRMKPEEDGSISFFLYKGVNRSYSQETNPWVVFSTKYENLKSSEMAIDMTDLKNFILVRSSDPDIVENGDGTVSYVSSPVEVGYNDELKGFERREIFKKSNDKAPTVNAADFGTPEDRVDTRAFSTYECVYFDSDAYNRDMDKVYDTAMNSFGSAMAEPDTVWERRWLKPGDEGYIPEIGGSVGQSQLVAVDNRPRKDKAREQYSRYVDSHTPNPRDYQVWDWVLSDQAGYEAALAAAQEQINLEIAQAIRDGIEGLKSRMLGDGMAELSKYSTVSTFDGELNPLVQFIYGNDYYLGDKVQIVNEFNFQAETRVVGMMFSEEEGVGYLAMPSFESDDKAVFEI